MIDSVKEKNELEMAYQQQVDGLFFYGYCCCMKKHVITDDILSIPSDDEDEAMLGDEAILGDDSTTIEDSVVEDDSTVVDDEVQDIPK